MNEFTTRLEEMTLKDELFDYRLPETCVAWGSIMNNFTYNGTFHTQRNTIFDIKVEKWILENISKVYMNTDYHNADSGCYGDDDDYTSDIVMLYFSSKEDLMAFKLRWG